MNTRHAFDLLPANGPYAPLAEKLMLYGQFVGSWDVESVWTKEDGARSNAKGEWHFAWALGGRAVQDVLFAQGASPDELGTTLRGYDHEADVWHITWMQPSSREFTHLVGRREDDRIVQTSTGPDTLRRKRWTFEEITTTTFLWRGEESLDDGRTWRLVQEMHATRRSAESSRHG